LDQYLNYQLHLLQREYLEEELNQNKLWLYLVHWKQCPEETGIIIDIGGEQIKVVDLNGDFLGQSDWWARRDWKLVSESA